MSFGSASSTSGHLMPRSLLLAAGIDPDRDFKRVAYSGAHDATVAAVASGKVDAGALNIWVWERLVADKKVDPAGCACSTRPGRTSTTTGRCTPTCPPLSARSTAAFTDLSPRRPRAARSSNCSAPPGSSPPRPKTTGHRGGSPQRRPAQMSPRALRAFADEVGLHRVSAPPSGRAAGEHAGVASDFTWSGPAGEQLAVIGPSGAGKTTLLHCSPARCAPRRALRLGGRDPWQLARRDLQRLRGGCSLRRRCRRCRRASASSRRCWPGACRRIGLAHSLRSLFYPTGSRGRRRAGPLRPERQAVRPRRPPLRWRAPARRPGAGAGRAGASCCWWTSRSRRSTRRAPRRPSPLTAGGARVGRHAGGHAARRADGAGAISPASSGCAMASSPSTSRPPP